MIFVHFKGPNPLFVQSPFHGDSQDFHIALVTVCPDALSGIDNSRHGWQHFQIWKFRLMKAVEEALECSVTHEAFLFLGKCNFPQMLKMNPYMANS